MTTTATLEVTDFSRIAPLLNAVDGAGLPVLRSVTFTLRNSAQAQAQALVIANRNAHDQAAAALAETGRRLGGMVDESVNVSTPTDNAVFMGGGGGGGGAPTDGFGTRQITITARVTTTFALLP